MQQLLMPISILTIIKKEEIEHIIFDDPFTTMALYGVSYDLASCKQNLALSKQYHKLRASFWLAS